LKNNTLRQVALPLVKDLFKPSGLQPTKSPQLEPAQTSTQSVRSETNAQWQEVIVDPSVVLLLGKRGSGKSALGYRLLELLRYRAAPYVLGLPKQAQGLLPDWIGIAQNLEDIPAKSVVLVDEAHLQYHSRQSSETKNKEMSRILNLSRQTEQTIIFVSQEARQIDKNIASSANVVIFKDLGILQLEFDRPELNKIAAQAKQAFDLLKGDKRKWSYVYSHDANFIGLVENSLPTYWSSRLSHAFAGCAQASATRTSTKVTLEERIRKAQELHESGLSLGQIATMLGVSKSTAFNYVNGYPYKA
jgi:archaellum biogenesis ATPase FlaH